MIRLLLLPLAFLLTACTGGSSAFRANPNPGGWPFVPTSMRIFPLTHIDRSAIPPPSPANPSGPSPADNIPPQDVTPRPAEVRLIVHLEFRDAWGDSTKAVGPLTLLLYGRNSNSDAARRTAPADSADPFETQQRRYDIDLSDLKRNAELYDPATRTYRIPLTGLPNWIVAAPAESLPRIILRAELKSPRADAAGALLVDEWVVTR